MKEIWEVYAIHPHAKALGFSGCTFIRRSILNTLLEIEGGYEKKEVPLSDLFEILSNKYGTEESNLREHLERMRNIREIFYPKEGFIRIVTKL